VVRENACTVARAATESVAKTAAAEKGGVECGGGKVTKKSVVARAAAAIARR